MTFGIEAVYITDLCQMIMTQAQKYSGLPAEYVFWSVASEDWLLKCPPTDNFVTLFPESLPVWQGVVAGAGASSFVSPGRENLGFDLTMRVNSYTRLNTDQEFWASQLLTSQTLGIMSKTTNIIAALQMWQAISPGDDSVSLLREPARIIDGPKLQTRDYHKTLWTVLTMRFQFRFTCRIDTPLTTTGQS